MLNKSNGSGGLSESPEKPSGGSNTFYELKKTTLISDGSLIYNSPHLASNQEKREEISTDYLVDRLTYALEQLRHKLEVTTSNHNTSLKKEHLDATDRLESEIMDILSNIEDGAVTTREEIGEICKKLNSAVYNYKSKKGSINKLKVFAVAAERIFQEEREAIKRLFNLPQSNDNSSDDGSFIDSESESVKESYLENQEDPEIRALVKRILENPDFYFQLEKVYASNQGQIKWANKLLRPVVETNKIIQTFLEEAYDKLNKLQRAMERLPNDQQEAFDLMKNTKIDSADAIAKLPKAIQKGFQEVYSKYINTLGEIATLVDEYSSVFKTIQVHHKQQDEYKKAITIGRKVFDTINEKEILNNYYQEFEKLQSTFEDTNKIAEKALGGIGSFLLQIPSQTQAKDPRVKRILSLVNSKYIPFIRQFIKEHSQSEQVRELEAFYREENEAAMPAEQQSSEADSSALDNEEKAVESENKRIRWSKLEHSERIQLIREKVFNGWPLIKYLVQQEKWNDLRLILDSMKNQQLRSVGLGQPCFDKKYPKAPYKTKDELLEAVFPEVYSQDSVEQKLTNERNFHWKKKTLEEVQSEARRRLFKGWPLIELLVRENKHAELRDLLDFTYLTTYDRRFKIGRSCVGNEDAFYSSKKEFLESVLPEASPEQD